MDDRITKAEGSLLSYTIGFILSIILSLLAYVIITQHIFARGLGIMLISALAVMQFILQLIFFLHIGVDTKPRWKLCVLAFMLVVVGILVGGSLWIMHNLNYNMMNMSPTQIMTYMNDNQGL